MKRSSIFNTPETNYCFFSFCWRKLVTREHQTLSNTSFSAYLARSSASIFFGQLSQFLPQVMTCIVSVHEGFNLVQQIPTPPQPSDVTSVVHVTQVNMNVNIPTPPQPSLTSPPHPNPVTWRRLCMWRKLTWTLTSPPHPNPVTWRQLSQLRMWRKLTWTLTSPPHPNPVTWRQLCMWRKLTWTLTSPPHPNPVTWR